MAVGFVASATSGSQASVASFNIGTLGTGARAGIVFVCIHNSATDIITGVTWNGVAMTLIGKATDTDTEPGVVKAYFLDNVANGTITVSRTNNSVVTVGYAASISAAMACRVSQYITRVASTQNTDADTSTTGTGASGEVAVNDGSPGTNSMRFAAAYTGAASPVAQGTNSSALQSLDSTALGSSFVRETTAGQGSRSVGFATGTTDDWALVAVAVSENNRNASVTATGGGVVTPALTTNRNRAMVDTGAGILTASQTTARSSSPQATGGGAAVATGAGQRAGSATATGAGGLTTSTVAGRELVAAATGGGIVTIDYDRSAATENHDASVTATGGGAAAASLTTSRAASPALTGGGAAAPSSTSDRALALVATGAGAAAVALATARSSNSQATGAGVAALQAESARSLAALLTGGGVLTLDELAARASSVAATGGGVATVDGTQETNFDAAVQATGGGVAALDVATARELELVVAGGGVAALAVSSERQAALALTGGGVLTLDARAGGVGLPDEITASVAMAGSAALVRTAAPSASVQSSAASAAVTRTHHSAEVTIR